MRGPMVCAFLFVKSGEAHVRNENDVRAWEKMRQISLLFLFIVIKYNHNKERGGLVWLMQ